MIFNPLYEINLSLVNIIHQFLYLIYQISLVWTQFVVQTDSALAQWAQDNKFVESGLENWVLVNSGYCHHKFKDSFNETIETNGKRFSIREVLFLYYSIFFICHCW